MAGGANLLVLDEPTSAMDLVAEHEVVDILIEVRRRFSVGILLVSHHLGMLVSLVDRLVFLDADDEIVVTGAAADVMAHAAFIEHYGAVLKQREHATHRPNVTGDGR
jgi:ABC-type Mn2+/Zn2+ transport system ATPase subunit